jgi:hypothetical protein
MPRRRQRGTGTCTEFQGATALKRFLVVAALALVVLASPMQTKAQPSWSQVGALTCRLNPSIGFIIAGHQSMECTFQPAGPFPPQAYQGAFNIVGLDVGVTAGGILSWTVFAPTTGFPAGALAGEYVGASGDVGLGVGAGANILLGGSGRTFALQPLSIQGSVAFNIALGVSMLTLRAV